MKKSSLYSPHPAFAMEAAGLRLLKERTGRTLEHWVALVQKRGPRATKERVAWLKADHGITTNYAQWIVARAEGDGGEADYDPDALVAAMFAGKEALRPAYDRLLRLALKLGRDVKACPGKTIVPLYRTHVFAQLKPSTKTRLDLGLALGDTRAVAPLIDTGGFLKKDRITHRIAIVAPADLDETVVRWLRVAYDRDAP